MLRGASFDPIAHRVERAVQGYPAIAVAKQLVKDGVSVTVINARFVKPLDDELILNTIKAADRVITVEEGVLDGGFGSAVLELLAEKGINIPVKRLGLPAKFIEQGKRAELLDIYGLTPQKIHQSILA